MPTSRSAGAGPAPAGPDLVHELANALTSALGHAELTRGELPAGSAVRAGLDEVVDAVLRARELLASWRSASGRLEPPAAEESRLGRALGRHASSLRAALPAGCPLDVELEDGLPEIAADFERLRFRLLDLALAVAALREVGAEGLRFAARARLGAGGEAEEVLLEWTRAAAAGADPGEEAGDAAGSRAGGLEAPGLGSAMAALKSLGAGVRLLGGSSGPLGVRVSFPALPLAPSERPAASPGESGHVEERPHADRGAVLVVDDDASIRELAVAMLEGMGLGAAVAADGLQAVQHVQLEPERFGAVLLDLSMPGFDGRRTLSVLRRIVPGLRVVACSGLPEDAARRLLGAEVPSGFLQKPFTAADLRGALEGVMGS